ncbi:MAG TPA: AI-2E family transporter [Gammaproteobacteria bacterium]|nr:AI-2E family transporter [Gammaproteobacteria bacterium]
MAQLINQYLFVFLIVLLLALLYLLSPILTPFLLGTLLAYLVNPLVKRLEKWKIPHLISVIMIFLIVIGIFFLIVIMLIPVVNKQIILLEEVIPQVILWLQHSIMPQFVEFFNLDEFKPTLATTLSKTSVLFGAVLSSGSTLIGWMINLILTPVVTFYLLCDWDRILHGLRKLLPRSIAATVVQLVRKCDEVLGAFFRGQLLIMLLLCLIYGVGLTLVGLQVGLMLGIIGGILSVVPYLGSIFVVVSASIVALVQFGDWASLFWVWGIFIIGQIIEGYVLTPYLIGKRIGLHPVAVIFAIMAGGSLFGFFGILLALPVAAVLMVLLQYASLIVSS